MFKTGQMSYFDGGGGEYSETEYVIGKQQLQVL